jgi:VacB/RNase II family 3'-5' exoribonuclease
MAAPNPEHVDLQATAERIMREHGFALDRPPGTAEQLADVRHRPAAIRLEADVRDLRRLAWSSIDNDTSRDLDQLEVAEPAQGGATKLMVAIADVDAFVPKNSPIDRFAADQTTTVYTGVRNFPMLPDALSTDATSLLEAGDKLTVVVELLVTADGQVASSSVYRAVVRNTAQLTYDEVGAWLDGRAPAPAKVAATPGLDAQLRLQHGAAQALRTERHRHGALNIQTIETRPIVRNEQIVDLETQEKNSATALIEDFMIAVNEVVARLLEGRGVSSIRRVVREPARWERIVALAAASGGRLPAAPDSKALNEFLLQRAQADPDRFPDLSLAVVKLMGPGEYVVERPGERAIGHFGLAVDDYTHSTAPNRRFADLVTQRIVKGLLAGVPTPYGDDALAAIAANCTVKANAARKVEREMSKRIAAVALQPRLGERFEAIVTGVTPHGTFVRVVRPHVEGLLAQGQNGLDVGDKVQVKLVRTDVERGYIDFARV